jgi:signal transduction histidine kinase
MFRTLKSRIILLSLGGIALGLGLAVAAVLTFLPSALQSFQEDRVARVVAQAYSLDGSTGIDEIVSTLTEPGVSVFAVAGEEQADDVESPTQGGISELVDNEALIAQSVFLPESDIYLTVTVAKITAETLTSIVLLIAIPVALIVFVAVGLALFFSMRRTLLPVSDFSDKAAQVAAGARGVRLEEPHQIEEVKRAAHAVDTMVDSLEQSEASLRQMSSDVVHEMKTPLSTIVAMSENLMRAHEKADIEEGAIGIVREARRAAAIVNDLAAIGDQPSQSTVELGDHLVSTLVQAWPFAAAGISHLEISLEMTPEVAKTRVHTDRRKVEQILSNLVSNASIWAARSISLLVGIRHDTIVFTLADDGPGVPEGLREKIFERFYRTDQSRARATGGSGLGLAISRSFAHELGGSLSCEPSEQGGLFVLKLPLITPQA